MRTATREDGDEADAEMFVVDLVADVVVDFVLDLLVAIVPRFSPSPCLRFSVCLPVSPCLPVPVSRRPRVSGLRVRSFHSP